MRDYFYHLQSHHRPVNDLSTAVKLTNHLVLCFWADGGFVYHKRLCSLSFVKNKNLSGLANQAIKLNH